VRDRAAAPNALNEVARHSKPGVLGYLAEGPLRGLGLDPVVGR
jgi:hypothetical protein